MAASPRLPTHAVRVEGLDLAGRGDRQRLVGLAVGDEVHAIAEAVDVVRRLVDAVRLDRPGEDLLRLVVEGREPQPLHGEGADARRSV